MLARRMRSGEGGNRAAESLASSLASHMSTPESLVHQRYAVYVCDATEAQ